MKNKKTIGLITQSLSTSTFIKQQLIRFLEPYLNVNIWCIDDENNIPAKFAESSDIYLCSNNSVYSYAHKYLPTNKRVILARRTVDVESLHKILDITSGEKVLVVTTTKETAHNTIEILQGLGIWHIDFEAYWPLCNKVIANNIKIAITTGLAYLAPQNITRVIDIGGKGIDISTFYEIFHSLDIPMQILDSISNYYLRAILRNNMQIRDSALQNERLGKNLNKILDNVMEGILAIDNKRKIRFCNPVISEMLGISVKSIINKDIKDIFSEFKPDFLKIDHNNTISERVVVLNGSFYALRIYTLEGRLMGIDDLTVISLCPAETLQEMDKKVRNALKHHRKNAKYTFEHIVGQSEGINRTISLSKRFAKTDLAVLIEGESGTGKELFAHAIHNYSYRAKEPFVVINFASIPENLAESILFGYVEGAFTGSKKGGSIGLFEEAHGGTIFLDELSSASLDIQNRLLRVLEESEIRRVGGNSLISVNVRVIAASNMKLIELVEKGLFRKDLFYRICAAPVFVPPLRNRKSDIPLLIDYFASSFASQTINFSSQLRDFLMEYNWPGNVRELNNVVRYIYNVTHDNSATLDNLPDYILNDVTEKSISIINIKNDVNPEFLKVARQTDEVEIIANILDILWSAKVFRRKIGRQVLQKELAKKNIILSEHKIKHWLTVVISQGYAETGTTKQGVTITPVGKSALEYLLQKETHVFV